MSNYFELIADNNGARTGILKTRAGKVLTPTFMPDGTRGAVKSVTPEQVESTGVQIVLANTYHLHMQPGEEVISQLGGLHKFANRKGPMLTDSGGFQVFSLAKVRKITEEGVTFKDPGNGDMVFLSPEKSIQIQLKMGADMIVAFDDVVSLDEAGRARTLEAFERTHRWLERNLAEFQLKTKDMKPDERPLLFGVVQGGLDKDLRKKSLEMVQSLPVDGIAIGGLSVGESRTEMHDMLEFLAPLYDPSRPHFLLGVGDPVDLRFAVEHGIDMLDCVLPTRNARHGTVWVSTSPQPDHELQTSPATPGTPEALRSALGVAKATPPLRSAATEAPDKSGKAFVSMNRPWRGAGDKKIHLTNERFAADIDSIDPGCDCTTCTSGYSKGFLRHQFKVGEPLAGTLSSIHNIRYLERICESYRAD